MQTQVIQQCTFAASTKGSKYFTPYAWENVGKCKYKATNPVEI